MVELIPDSSGTYSMKSVSFALLQCIAAVQFWESLPGSHLNNNIMYYKHIKLYFITTHVLKLFSDQVLRINNKQR